VYNLKQIFCEEDKMCIDMRQQYVKYLKRQSLGLIPLYVERLEAIDNEIRLKK